jgi:enoyl-CoA hydratase/carnithine racemase
MTDEVLYEEDSSGVALITINRPKALNSLNVNIFQSLLKIALKLRARESSVKCVILTSAGRAFSAGNDVAKGGKFTSGQAISSDLQNINRLQVDTIEALTAIPQPLLLAVNGLCYTGALELLMVADIIFASEENAMFCDTHAHLGLVPTWGLSVRLPRKIGLANAKLMSFSGRKYDAVAAEKMGLVDVVVPHKDLISSVQALAADIVAKSGDSIQKQKRMMNMGAMTSQRDALAWTDEVYGFHPGMASDMKERMTTLFGKKKAKL